MFNAIKAPLSLAAVVALTAACSSGTMSVPGIGTQSAAPAATLPAIATAPIVETATPTYQSYQVTPASSQPTLASTQVPLTIESPVSLQASPVLDVNPIQPASVSTFSTDVPALPSYSTPTMSSYSTPALPSYSAPALPAAPVASSEYVIQPPTFQ